MPPAQLRSFFVFSGGVVAPANFKPNFTPLLTIQDLWEYGRQMPPSLLFRVRAGGDAGTPFDPTSGDRLESCVGLLDSATRWRCVFNMTRTAINAIRQPVLAEACNKAMAFLSTSHPASIVPNQRIAIAQELIKIADETEGVTRFEAYCARGVAQLAQYDNDAEAAIAVPFASAYCPFPEGPEQSSRVTTVETMAGAVLLTETANRLAERAPQWISSEMPNLGAPNGDDE